MAEAHACGVPVIAPRAGAAVEIVDDPATGTLLETIAARSLSVAVRTTRGRGDLRPGRPIPPSNQIRGGGPPERRLERGGIPGRAQCAAADRSARSGCGHHVPVPKRGAARAQG